MEDHQQVAQEDRRDQGAEVGGPLLFGDSLRITLHANLARFPYKTQPAEGRRLAAVAVVVVPDATGQAAVVLTRRAAGLRRHGGQWACPGGRLDPGETPGQAALRELDEEVGLLLPPSHILGFLDDYPTRSGFVITPVVVWGSAGAPLRPNPREVAGVYRVPVEDLLDPERVVVHPIPESDRPVLALALLETLIYAPTAAVLHQFGEVAVRGREMRVDGYEQPPFAWR